MAVPEAIGGDEPMAAKPRGGVAWEVDTGALPAAARPKAEPRPPRWAASGQATYGRGVHRSKGAGKSRPAPDAGAMTSERIGKFLAKQRETLQQLQNYKQEDRWDRIHRAHYDWWMFPIDDGSKADFNVYNEEDVDALKSNEEWLANYHEGVALVAEAWGWDVAASQRIEQLATGQAYSGWDVRLAKMCRSLYLFEQKPLLDSMQAFAREVQQKEKEGGSFFYGTVCLDELLYFELPRR
eukprot:TRINITY_DN4441_c0_g6_i1.p1 TRINITY_DN4441_c0_g6~~TRINITY_DN4441_c0_g6_i1.p1  ORF type:complete len:239 (+),score=56.93 TRINITY_DN4441_c0_g6_i1:44-760(+)